MKYKFKKIDKLPQHIQRSCYIITNDGHTMFPADVAKRLNDLERALFNAPEKASSNTAYTKSCKSCKHGVNQMPYSSHCVGCCYENDFEKFELKEA